MKKILIVDDSAFTRDIHKQIVISAGYQVLEAENGSQALEVFEKERPDLVIMDLLMPDMDGMEIIKRILETDPHAKTVICSTDKQKARQAEAREIGVLGFLTKPINAEEATEMIDNLLSQ